MTLYRRQVSRPSPWKRKLLVKFGADIRLANRDGWSALHIAAFGGHQDIVLYLITKAKYAGGGR